MDIDLVIAAAATLGAVATIVVLGVRLIRSLVLYRMMSAVRSYPNVAMALALAAQGEDEDLVRFRAWVARSVEENGWEKTDEVLGEMLVRMYPLGAMGATVSEDLEPVSSEQRHW